jgi:hypothetical protein
LRKKAAQVGWAQCTDIGEPGRAGEMPGQEGQELPRVALIGLERERGQVQREHVAAPAVELAKEWRKDKFLQKLQALLAVMDKETCLIISGQGDVIEPDDRILAIGSPLNQSGVMTPQSSGMTL